MVNSSSRTEGKLSSLDLTLYNPSRVTHSFAKWMHQHKHIPQDHHIGLLCLTYQQRNTLRISKQRNSTETTTWMLLPFPCPMLNLSIPCYQPSKLPVLYVDSLGILLWKTTDCLCWNCCFLLFFWSQRHSSIILKVVRKVLLHRA